MTPSFDTFRLKAAREFAHTMIVVDDQASQLPEDFKEGPVHKLKAPSKLSPPKPTSEDAPAAISDIKHRLNAKALIDKAMDLGLVCSVLRPEKGEALKGRIATVAKHADIVCLDWEIYEDSGASATKIIKEIARSDAKGNGRLRLIAIYTGDTSNNKILETVMEGFSESFRVEHALRRESLQIEGKNGLRIVCLFKTHGIELADARKANQVSEEDLPKRLQEEFAKLAEGLLSNVALATIASIRNSTHHVLAQFTAMMDGPYFHHRSILENVRDAEEYAVDVVLSELKNVVDKQDVAETYAGKEAIESRIQEIASDALKLHLHYEEKNTPKNIKLSAAQVVKMIVEGYKLGREDIPGNKPGLGVFKQELATLFFSDRPSAQAGSNQFAALTSVRAHPESRLYKGGDKFPHLGLGTIIRSPEGAYLMCLQATCDAVRIKTKSAFLFVPLAPDAKSPDHVVPVAGQDPTHIGLSISEIAYAEVVSLSFASNSTTETVLPERIPRKRGLHFRSSEGTLFLWVATLKQRRALRTAQRLGASMARLGFDEFEPLRK